MKARRLFPCGEHRFALEFLGVPTAHTDEMVMVTVVVVAGQFEPAPAFRQLQLPQQLHRTEQAQGAINRGQGDTLLGAQQSLMHLLSTEMRAFAQAFKQGQHTLTLRCEPLTTAVEAAAQRLSGEIGRRDGRHQRTVGAVLNSNACCEQPPDRPVQ